MLRQVSRMRYGLELVRNAWICEPAIWVKNWQTVGELLVTHDGTLLALEASRLVKIVSVFRPAQLDVALYAQWALTELRSKVAEGDLTDCWHPDWNAIRNGMMQGSTDTVS